MVTSIGVGRQAFTESLMTGKSGIVQMEDVDTLASDQKALAHLARRYQKVDGSIKMEQRTAIAGPVSDFDPKQFVKPRKALKVMCREIQTAYASSQLAVSDAGLDGYLPAELDADPSYQQGAESQATGSARFSVARCCTDPQRR